MNAGKSTNAQKGAKKVRFAEETVESIIQQPPPNAIEQSLNKLRRESHSTFDTALRALEDIFDTDFLYSPHIIPNTIKHLNLLIQGVRLFNQNYERYYYKRAVSVREIKKNIYPSTNVNPEHLMLVFKSCTKQLRATYSYACSRGFFGSTLDSIESEIKKMISSVERYIDTVPIL